ADDLARHRRVDVGSGLHRFDDAHRFARVHLASHRGRLDENDVAQLFLRVVGDADGERGVAFAADPLVRFGVAQLLRGLHALVSWISTRIFPLRTNGSFTTRAASCLSRTWTWTVEPGATPRGRRARAMERESVGENVPLVISPSPAAVATFWCARSTPPA